LNISAHWYRRINSTNSAASAQVLIKSWENATSRENALSRVRVNQCVFAVRAVEVSVLACLGSSGCHVTELRGP